MPSPEIRRGYSARPPRLHARLPLPGRRGSDIKSPLSLAMKEYIPNIRVISVDHERTSLAAAQLRHALDAHGLKHYRVLSSFCHLEAGRWGVPSGKVAIDVDGQIIWAGPELSEALAEEFCAGLPAYIRKQKEKLGLA